LACLVLLAELVLETLCAAINGNLCHSQVLLHVFHVSYMYTCCEPAFQWRLAALCLQPSNVKGTKVQYSKHMGHRGNSCSHTFSGFWWFFVLCFGLMIRDTWRIKPFGPILPNFSCPPLPHLLPACSFQVARVLHGFLGSKHCATWYVTYRMLSI